MFILKSLHFVKIIRFLIILTIISLFVSSEFPYAQAHPGQTDANGGHYNRKTGEYHYHHGFPEHSHYDVDGDGITDCPYDFKDLTGQNSGSPSSKRSSSSEISKNEVSTNSSIVTSSSKPKISKTESSDVPHMALFVVLSISFFLITARLWIIKNNREASIDNLNTKLSQQEQQYKNEIQRIMDSMQQKLEQNEAHYLIELQKAKSDADALRFQLNKIEKEQAKRLEEFQKKLNPSIVDEIQLSLGDDYLLKLSGAPEGTTIDVYGKPHQIINGRDIYHFYETPTKYHTPLCQFAYSSKSHPVNAVDMKIDYRHSACMNCRPVLPDVQWYSKYLFYKKSLSNSPKAIEANIQEPVEDVYYISIEGQ